MNVFIRLMMESFLIMQIIFNYYSQLSSPSGICCKIKRSLRKTTAQAPKICKICRKLFCRTFTRLEVNQSLDHVYYVVTYLLTLNYEVHIGRTGGVFILTFV